MSELMSVPRDYWLEDAKEVRHFIDEQVIRNNPLSKFHPIHQKN
uniref:Uncharacterized protein n=1 Tax=Parascaris equorum TaxID=6256 RepID=A0A914RJ18_PAREQ